MYNGIGLQTARGSGTNGYVQSNRFFVKPRLSKVVTDSSIKGFGSGEGTAGLSRKPNREILEHDRKRQIQLKLLVLEEKLTDQGYTDSEIAEKLEEARANLEAEAAADALEDGEVGPTSLTDSKISDTQTHQIAARKELQMETLRAALGIGADSQNKRYALVPSDSEDANNDDEPANSHKKDGNSKKSLKGVVDNTSDLRNVKKSRGDESAEDTYDESARLKKQKSGRAHRADISDSDDSEENVVKKDRKSRRKTSSSDSDVKRKKKTSKKSRSRRRKHDSDSANSGSESDSGSETDSSFDSGSRKHGKSLKKVDPREDNGSKYHKRDVKEATKKPRKPSISSESDHSDYVKKKKISSKISSRSRRHDSDSSSSESDYAKKKKITSKNSSHSRRHDSDSSSSESDSRSDTKSISDSESDDVLEQRDRGIQSGRKSKEQSTLGAVKVGIDRDLNDRRSTGKEHGRGNGEKAQHDRDSDGLDTLRKLEKLYQPKEEKTVKSDRAGKELNRSKRKIDDGNWDEQSDRKSKRRDMSDLEFNDEVKHSLGSKDHSENRITDRWGAEPAHDYDLARRDSGEERERPGRKHRRDEEEDRHRINDREKEQQQLERNKGEPDDRRSSKYDGDRDRDSAKRPRYDDSRSSGRRYGEDDDRHGRKYSDGRHDDRRSRR